MSATRSTCDGVVGELRQLVGRPRRSGVPPAMPKGQGGAQGAVSSRPTAVALLERYVDARELAALMGVSTSDDQADGRGRDAVARRGA